MRRNIYIVNATQVVVSTSHPEGLYSTVDGYPKSFDSRSYPAADENPNGDTDAALRAAKAAYYSRLSANYTGSASRVMAVVTLEQADGKTILRDTVGEFPDMTPEPVEEPEELEEP